MTMPVHIVVVTHNSAVELQLCLAGLRQQNIPISSLTVIDSGSEDTQYLDAIAFSCPTKIIKGKNIGFGRANNIGFEEGVYHRQGMVVFMNPDIFLTNHYLAQAVYALARNPRAAIVSGKLLGFDLERKEPTGRIDSTGVFRRWYGKWYDRGQDEKDRGQYDVSEFIPVVCGALMCCRIKALDGFKGIVFDPDFFLYKEDIELSLRLRDAGWLLLYEPGMIAYHCRGWNKKRRKIPLILRLTAARNEILLYKKHPSPFIIWALLKYLLVRIFRL